MKKNLTSINVVLDASGSMANLTSDTLGGLNSFIEEQKSLPGEATFTLCTFNSSHEIVHEGTPLHLVASIDKKSYSPKGGTNLIGTLGYMIDKVGKDFSSMKENERPFKVIFVVITDGENNLFSDYTKQKVKEMIEHQTNNYKWEFLFFGANIDSFSEAASYGISSTRTKNFEASPSGTKNMYRSMSKSVSTYRTSGN